MNDEADQAVEIFKVKKLIKTLDAARGNGTSMISLVIAPGEQVSRIVKMLNDEAGTAVHIKSNVNKKSVLTAITSTIHRIKRYTKIPTNGLVVYVGTVMTAENKERKVAYSITPFKPINTSLYMCDSRFHTEALHELLESDSKFGFIVMDGNGCLYGTLSGNTRAVLHKFSVDLPKKHGRGGQSAMRFGRIRLEKRHNFVRKVAETAVQFFITADRPNVTGLILAGSAEFKQQLQRSDLLDNRLADIILKLVDVSYGGENGFNQAIELSAECLANVKFVNEKKLLSAYFNEIAMDTGLFCYGVRDTFHALESGAVEKLIIWENLEISRMELRNNSTKETKVIFLTPEERTQDEHFVDPDTGVELEVLDDEMLVEWLANNYKDYGTVLEFITDRSQEGHQFVQGFGGIGGTLRYQVDFMLLDDMEEIEELDLEDFM